MKYLNSLVFLGLMVMVAGCQKKEKVEPKKGSHHTSAHDAKAAKGHKQGPTKLETKKSAMHKDHEKKNSHYTSAHDAREAKGEKLGFTKLESKNSSMHKDAHKKAAPKKDHEKKNKKSGNMN